jgi:hypothetical protein
MGFPYLWQRAIVFEHIIAILSCLHAILCRLSSFFKSRSVCWLFSNRVDSFACSCLIRFLDPKPAYSAENKVFIKKTENFLTLLIKQSEYSIKAVNKHFSHSLETGITSLIRQWIEHTKEKVHYPGAQWHLETKTPISNRIHMLRT